MVPGLYVEKGWVHDGIDYSFTPPPEEKAAEPELEEEEEEGSEAASVPDSQPDSQGRGTIRSGTRLLVHMCGCVFPVHQLCV